MIKFFRKIRQRLLTENKFSKYVLYAIGEIVLVVIGILIALQINTWNEYQNVRVLERETLVEILANITEIESDLAESLERIIFLNKYTDSVLALLETKVNKPWILERTLHKAFLNTDGQIQIKKVGYETLKNRGVDIVLNKELKNSILHLFEDSYVLMSNSFKWKIEDKISDYMLKNFNPSPSEDGILYSPYDYGFVISDNYFNSLMQTHQLQTGYFHSVISYALEDTRETKALVTKELNIKNP
ncbi:DUF6090 family protein [Maribacter arcticus]|uniref:DUF6090 family protein n=1 Tax=Maribacter arcticus TaxID=561365 RepID=UPI003002D131